MEKLKTWFYRVKPGSVVRRGVIYGYMMKGEVKYKLTLDTIDGEPVISSVKLTKVHP